MFRMLIVEDEEIEREGLRDLIDWNSMDINVVGAVESAEQAIRFVENHEIDILFTDIKLCGLTGLDLAKILSERFPNLKVIIASGYQDFEFAKTAIELDAYGFLTKPIEMDELEFVISKVLKTFRKENEENEEKERLKKLLNQSMPLLKNKFFTDLINGDLDLKIIDENLAYFDIKLNLRHYISIVAEVDNYEEFRRTKSREELYIMELQLLEIMEACKSDSTVISFHISQAKYCSIYNTDVLSLMELYQKLMDFTKKIQKKVNDSMGIEITIGIGKVVNRLTDLKTSYKRACEAVDYKFYMGGNQIINCNDINSSMNSNNLADMDIEDIEKKIVSSIELCNYDTLEENFSKLFQLIRSNTNTSNTYIKNIFINLLAMAQVKLLGMNESFENIFGKENYIWEKVMKFDTIADAQQWIMNIFKAIIEHLSKKKDNSNKKIIKDILNIMEKNYNKNISIADISHEVFLSPNYISIIFKKEMGESFTEYLVRYKIEKAKQMLKETNLKIYQIGSMVGYSNISHFCSVFKSFYGVSPSEYRDKL